jgi:predicted Fe-Mo cluster-binding NifX family protein
MHLWQQSGTELELSLPEMKVAIPHWQGRVSPVFDVAGNVWLVDVADGAELARQNVSLTAAAPQARAKALAELGTDVLVCGAISWPLEMAIAAAGIEVIPQTCGDVERVLAAFISGQLNQDAFLMPGCCGRRQRFRARRRRGRR